MIDRETFYARIRPLFNGRLTEGQFTGIQAILDEWDRRGLSDLRWLAYMLATAYWEVAKTMQPIREYGRGRGKKYGRPGRNGRQVPYGRGLVQLTWDENYEKADRKLGLNGALIRNYDLALVTEVAVKIMFDGMIEGWFTGRRLPDYLNSKTDWINARRIINGTDRATQIANIAMKFHSALVAGEKRSPAVASLLSMETPDMTFVFDLIKPAMVGSAIRALMATYGGVLVEKGFATADDVTALTGGAVVLGTMIWSYIAKKYQGVV